MFYYSGGWGYPTAAGEDILQRRVAGVLLQPAGGGCSTTAAGGGILQRRVAGILQRRVVGAYCELAKCWAGSVETCGVDASVQGPPGDYCDG